MGNSVVRQTVFRESWWAEECRRDSAGDVKTIDQPPRQQREHRAVEKESSNGGRDDLDTTLEDGGRDAAVGHQMVGSYYTTLYNAPGDVWCLFKDDVVYNYVNADGTRYVAAGWTKIRELFKNVATSETGNEEDDDGDCRSLVVQSVETVRCPSGQLLIMASTERFGQSFVVESTAPDPFAMVASVVIAKRAVCTEPQTPQTPLQSPPPPPARVDDQDDHDDQWHDMTIYTFYN